MMTWKYKCENSAKESHQHRVHDKSRHLFLAFVYIRHFSRFFPNLTQIYFSKEMRSQLCIVCVCIALLQTGRIWFERLAGKAGSQRKQTLPSCFSDLCICKNYHLDIIKHSDIFLTQLLGGLHLALFNFYKRTAKY